MTLAQSALTLPKGISTNVPVIDNGALGADSLCTTDRAGINFYSSSTPVSKVFFKIGCVCCTLSTLTSSKALVNRFVGIAVA